MIFFLLQGKVPLLSRHALEQIHIFIFVLAITHVVLSAVTVLLGLLQIRPFHACWFHLVCTQPPHLSEFRTLACSLALHENQSNTVHVQMRKWKLWENSIQEEGSTGRTTQGLYKHEHQFKVLFFLKNRLASSNDETIWITDAPSTAAPKMIKRVQKIKFIQDRCKGREKVTWVIIWMVCNCDLMLLLWYWLLDDECLKFTRGVFLLWAIVLQAVLRISIQRWLCRNEAWLRHGKYYLSLFCVRLGSVLLWSMCLVVDRSTLGGTTSSTFMTTWSKLWRKILRE